MSDQYVGEIRYFPYQRGAPQGWLVCDGSLQNLQSYQQLAALIGTTYGGDGQSTFGLPDLRGRVAIGAGGGYPLGSTTGQETVTLNSNQLPQHNHLIGATQNGAISADPTGQVFASGVALYTEQSPPTLAAMQPNVIGLAGQGLPHENCAPTLALLPCICVDGMWPAKPN